MCMQGFDSKRVLVVLLICSPFIIVGGGVVLAGRGIKHVAKSVADYSSRHPRKRDRLKAKVLQIKEKIIPDEQEQKLKQLQNLYEEKKGSEAGAYFALQLAVAHYYLRNEDEADQLVDETIKLLESFRVENKITYKGNKTLLFAYYLAATMANDDYKYDEALRNFDSAVQQWMILDSTPVTEKTAWTAHSFENRDFHKPRTCQVCQKALFGKTRHGLECQVCGAIVHPKCVVHVATPCNFSPNNNDHTGFEALISSQVALPTLLNSRGLAYYYAGHYDKALNDFDALINNQLKNNNDSTPSADEKVNLGLYHANRALVHFYKKDLENAIADTTTALALGFVNAQVYTIRASALQLLGRLNEAQEDRKKARECDPSAPLDVFPYELPMELIITVFSFLKVRDLAHAAQTCKLWKQIINDHTNLGLLTKYPDLRDTMEPKVVVNFGI